MKDLENKSKQKAGKDVVAEPKNYKEDNFKCMECKFKARFKDP